jgi:HPt (histidine-containing phosphotransfer) domain-containing protein
MQTSLTNGRGRFELVIRFGATLTPPVLFSASGRPKRLRGDEIMYLAPHVEGSCAPSFERPIDLVHLARQTLGDRALEREILDLFTTQVRAVLARLEAAAVAEARLDLAHTLKGSARAVGAWKVAAEAEACELHVADRDWPTHFVALNGAVEEAMGAIEALRKGA